MPRKVEISHRTVVFTVLFLLSLWFVFYIRDIIIEVFVALLIMAILNPPVTRLSKYKIPRSVSVLFVYLFLFLVIGFVLGAVIPPAVEQSAAFINNLPKYSSRIGMPVADEQIVRELISQIGAIPAQVAKVTISVFSNVLNVFAVLVFAFYFLSERNKLDDHLESLLGDHKKADFGRVIDKLETQLGGWARGQLTLMFVVGISSYVGLKLLGIPFSLPLAILAGMLEIVPFIGPIVAAVPAVIIGLGISPLTGAAVVSLAFLVQQLENYVLVPKILQKSSGVNPVIILLSLAIGARLAGLVGLLISVPVFITLRILTKEYLISK